ncbi:hypothetical protein H7F37_01365 [Winogradskyella sp. PAMC22761]|nr:hypothetical protein H7F37_01365 [Winogradskyella sp. PAMC22761]
MNIILISSIVMLNCKSHKEINKLASTLECTKPIEFIFDKQSNAVKIEKVGPSIGESKIPNYELTFIRAVNELNENMNTELKATQTLGFPSDSVLKVEVRIEKIIWDFRTTDAIMTTELNFKFEDKEIKTTGTNTTYVHGTKKGNLRKSLKSGIYEFLNIYCD